MQTLDLALASSVADIRRKMVNRQTPMLVALDGYSGAGKSTLASLIEQELDVAWVQSDDFFAAGIPDAGWYSRTTEERARDAIDWKRLRDEALEPLLAGRDARWHAFDFEAGVQPDGTYRMRTDYVKRDAAPVILLDGAYSARPELADLVDLSVLVHAPVDVRHARLADCEEEGFLQRWHARWDAAEKYYFTHVRPKSSFDLVVSLG